MAKQVKRHVKPNSLVEYVTRSVQSFLGDAPDNEYQRGFLSAMLAIAKEALGMPQDAYPFAEAEKLTRKRKRWVEQPAADSDA